MAIAYLPSPAALRAERADAADVPDWIRIGFIMATLLLGWVRLEPFHDLTSVANIEASDGGNRATQAAFSLLGALSVALLWRLGPRRLRALASPPLLLIAGWLAFSAFFSVAPGLSFRRLALLAIAFLASGVILVAARSVRQFATAAASSALIVLAICYVSLVLVPHLAMHTALDLREPEHAGAWRGLFPHKNEAGGVMVVFIFIGLLTMRVADRWLGALVTGLAFVFLVFTYSKTALALLPLALATTSLCAFARGPFLRAVLLLGPLAALLTITLGSLFIAPVKTAVAAILSDATFTGRSEIWEFTAEHILERPITGWGYGAFWKTEATLYGGSEQLTWVNQADQAHSGYLDAALFMGLPGLALVMIGFVAAPFRDLLRAAPRIAPDPVTLFFARLWVYGLNTAVFESILLDGNNSIVFMFTAAFFGLRFVAAHGPPQPHEPPRPHGPPRP